ncbi:hypothetical protein ACBI99_45015 [Nonomuraea sp. ATR24]|uniref:hypothetical protein n=1 Tax=Nonomuraea sp. ATR24 TaxID=1676744 RepID=UPI0035C0ACF1
MSDSASLPEKGTAEEPDSPAATEAAAGQPIPPAALEEKAPHVPVDDEEGDDDAKPLGQQLADEDAERRVREGNLRTLVRGSSHRIMDSALFETHNGDINIGLGQTGLVRSYLLSSEEVRQVGHTHVEVSSYRDLVNRLAMERVAVMKGQPNSGRHWTALAALGQWASEGAYEGLVRSYGTLTVRGDLVQMDAARLQKHASYVLDATGAAWTRHDQREVVRHLESLADELCGRFVVLTDPDGLPGHSSINHQPPDPREVFKSWLVWQLDKLGLSYSPSMLEELRHIAGEDRPPGESATLARESAMILADGGTTAEVVSGLPNALRQVAKELLVDDEATLHRRCFLISAAVLNELPLVTVSRAAALLGELVHPSPAPQKNTGPPSWEWLPEWLQFAQADCSSGENTTRVCLRRPRLAAAILEVIWQEGQSIRDPVLTWLTQLSGHPDRDVRIKAAHAIGRISAYDFKMVETEFLRRWSRSRRQNESWLAAWALEAAYADNPSRQVLDCLGGWLRTTTTRRTAARAYGSRIGIDRIDEALEAFQWMAMKSSPRERHLHDAIARSLTDVCTTGTAPTIVKELADWSVTSHAGLRRIAALALTRLATTDDDRHDRLRLDELGEESWPETEQHLVSVWLNALACGLSSRNLRHAVSPPVHEAWTAFGVWVSSWDSAPHRRRSVIERVFASSTTDLRGPLRLHLHHWFHTGTTSAGLSKHLHNYMKGGTT